MSQGYFNNSGNMTYDLVIALEIERVLMLYLNLYPLNSLHTNTHYILHAAERFAERPSSDALLLALRGCLGAPKFPIRTLAGHESMFHVDGCNDDVQSSLSLARSAGAGTESICPQERCAVAFLY